MYLASQWLSSIFALLGRELVDGLLECGAGRFAGLGWVVVESEPDRRGRDLGRAPVARVNLPQKSGDTEPSLTV